MISESVTVSNRGYIVLPAHIRKELNIKPGTTILLSKEDNKVILQPVSSRPAGGGSPDDPSQPDSRRA